MTKEGLLPRYTSYTPNNDKKLKSLALEFHRSKSGNKVEHWLNGKMVVIIDIDSQEFRDRVQAKFKSTMNSVKRDGHILIQDHDDKIHYRSV